ncbi:pantoate--beta-alanine ligase [Flavihumibacter sp. CACIAM 22H1]|uniref:pantoate--beta-alanine ligase n=1 Tax=Flavihumibacter sp. CACIAM 22H1 TaxID=1812911 RepID=UPI0007A878DE|nr:pantoate--beta-alanine ligase [Flavihumibacter sp. CACIAM 22H1]KYP14964.1 MAG: pantoate--beta-alanine ligase [Flavihumibacter sp. CACIAM 22H1]
MILFKQAARLRHKLQTLLQAGGSIGFVPTMGALHQGHLSLLEAAGKENSTVVCSIFVNPTQFNDPADFEKYPVTLEKDIELLEQAGVDILFLPSIREIYPEGTQDLPTYAIGFLETILEGHYRPGHFQGVCQVMHRLLDLVNADHLYMGQKDYQQCMVVDRLLNLTGITTKLHTCSTLREADGLAMSSRNVRLSAEDRSTARLISQVLETIRNEVQPGSVKGLLQNAQQKLESAGFKVDYVALAHARTLQLIETWDGKEPLVALAAAYIGGVRLIDNMLIHSIK